jgi:hypothetical protein
MTERQAKIAAVVLEYLPMTSPETAAEMSRKILEVLNNDQQRRSEATDARPGYNAEPHDG